MQAKLAKTKQAVTDLFFENMF